MDIETDDIFTKAQFNKILKKLKTPYTKGEDYSPYGKFAQEHFKIEWNQENGKIGLINYPIEEIDSFGNDYDSEMIADAIENIVDEIPTLNGSYTEMLETDGSVRCVIIKDSSIEDVKEFESWDSMNCFLDQEHIRNASKSECLKSIKTFSLNIDPTAAKSLPLDKLRQLLIETISSKEELESIKTKIENDYYDGVEYEDIKDFNLDDLKKYLSEKGF
jgi:hypothetical protein